MQSNFSQYSPQGLVPQFPGLQGAGWPQTGPGLFGQPGANSAQASFGQDVGQPGWSQQYPFGSGGQAATFAQNPFTPGPFWQNQSASSPYLQNQLLQSALANNPMLGSIAGQPAPHNPQYVIALLGQLAQQFSVHSALTQQIGIVLHQLTQQLAMQSSAAGLGAGGNQNFGQSPFSGAQGTFGGFNPQAQGWGANRPQTIQ